MSLMLIQFTEPLPVLQHLSLTCNLKHHGYQLRPSSWAWQGKEGLFCLSFAGVVLQRKTIWGWNGRLKSNKVKTVCRKQSVEFDPIKGTLKGGSCAELKALVAQCW